MRDVRKREIRPLRPLALRRRIRPQDYQLKRLPSDFCWRLFDLLVGACSDDMTVGVSRVFRDVARKRDPKAYFALDDMFGLQCIAKHGLGPQPGNPTVTYMLSSAFRKCTDMELLSSSKRRQECLAKVLLVDAGIPPLRKEWLEEPVYVHARVWLASLLGSPPDEDEIASSARHGPGSTANLPFAARSRYFKYSSWPYRTSPSCRDLLAYCIQEDARWASSLEDSVRRTLDIPMWAILNRPAYEDQILDGRHPYNVVTTVPKDGRKDRPIAKEQTGNIYLQLAVGRAIRRRLKIVGVDLDYQSKINRDYALRASRDMRYFTLDLSNASDTVGYELVKALLPDGWFRLLESLRSPWGVMPSGEAFLYRKFSSMGNGFTFELETIIFMAICHGVSKVYGHISDRFQVFGDDIIGPDYLFNTLRIYLEYSGFQVNSEKSFSGKVPVRESCGVDAVNGVDIRSPYIKGSPQTVMEMISVRNRLRRWFLIHKGEFPLSVDSYLLSWFTLLPPVGPDSDIEFDGWLQDGPWAEGRRFDALTPSTTEIPAKEFGFRKLMHTLKSCSTDGGNFVVSEPGRRIKLVRRVVDRQFDWLDFPTA